jgi:hypothetical protein
MMPNVMTVLPDPDLGAEITNPGIRNCTATPHQCPDREIRLTTPLALNEIPNLTNTTKIDDLAR